LLFEGFGKPVDVRFDAERQSDFGGATFLGAADRRLRLTAALAAAIQDPREAGKVAHEVLDMVRQRVYGIALGLCDVNDAARLRDDPAVRLACERAVEGEEGALASAPSLCRFENRANRRDLVRVAHALLDRVVGDQARRRRGRATRITVDLDPSDDPTHGQQEFAFFNGHYGTSCYLPLFGFVTFHDARGAEEPEQHLVAAVLRPGNAPATLGARGVLLRILRRLKASFPQTPIRVRLDGGFASGAFFDFLEACDVEYVVNLPKNPRLSELAEPLMEGVRRAAQASACSERAFGETMYAAETWHHQRRVVIKAEVVRDPARPEKGPKDNPRFVVTNVPASPERLYEAIYCRRGEIENRLKELKEHIRVDRTSCTGFWANQMRVLLSAAAYVLMQELRHHARATDLARAQVGTLRERLLLLSARVVESTRRILVRLSRTCPWQLAWRRVARSIGATTG
jgi:hypothetical protein